MSSTSITEKEVRTLIQGKLSRYFGVLPQEASREQIYKAVVMSVRDILLEKRQQFHKVMKNKKGKRVYYLCMEFLLGRSLKNNVYNLGLQDAYEKALKSYELTLEDLYEEEPDAGLGNGGLAAWQRALWMRSQRQTIPPGAIPYATITVCSNKRSWTAGRPNCPTYGCPAAKSG